MSGPAPASVPGSAPAAATANPSASAALGGGGSAPPAASAPAAAAPAAGGNTSPPAAGAPAAGGAPAADWLTGLDEGTRGFVTNKGWKNTSEVLGSYQNLEKLIGAPADKIVKLPAHDDIEGWKGVHAKLGCPQTPNDYGFNADPQKGGNKEFADWAGKNFHELGLSLKQGQNLAAKFDEYLVAGKTAQDAATATKLQEGAAAIKKEWGAAYDQNVQIAKRGAAAMGVDKATLDKIESAIGFDGVMKLFHGMGAKTGEASFVAGAGGNGALTPAAAMDQISALKADPGFVKRYASGDAEAKQKMHHLHQMAYQGDVSI